MHSLKGTVQQDGSGWKWYLSTDLYKRLRRGDLKKNRPIPHSVRARAISYSCWQLHRNDVITELFLPRWSLVSDIPARDGKLVNLFLRCRIQISNSAHSSVSGLFLLHTAVGNGAMNKFGTCSMSQ